MTCQTIALFFKVSSKALNDKAFDKDLDEIGRICLDDVITRQDVAVGNGDRIIVMISKNTSHATMRVYAGQGLVTVDVNYMCVGETKDHFETLEKVKQQYSLKGKGDTWQECVTNQLEGRIRDYLGKKCLKMGTLPVPIRRGDAILTYTCGSADNLLEMDFDKLVYRSVSGMQKIEVFHSPVHGNALLLDGDIMLSEGDKEYHEFFFGIGKHKRNDFKGKDILLLGGGGGAALNILLQEEPNMVVMCEIDGDVVDVSRKYMRKICGTCLDTMEGPHHKIIIDDGFQVLRDAVKEGKKFDCVVDDISILALDPEGSERYIDMASHSGTTLSLSKKLLKSGGIYFTSMEPVPIKYHTDFKKIVEALGGEFERREMPYLPAFLESYTFYEVTFPNNGH